MPPLAQAFRQTLLWGLAFAMLGSLLGMTLGWGAPVYYQTVFSLREGIDPGPVTVGASIGGMQGFIGGVIWFLVLAGVRAWAERPRPTSPPGEDVPTRRDRTPAGLPVFFLWLAGVLAALCLATVLGLVVGFVWGERSAHTRHLMRQRGRVVEILRRGQQPLVTFRQTSGIALKGTVSHQAALDQLRDDLIIEFGQDAVNAMLADVHVEAPALRDGQQ